MTHLTELDFSYTKNVYSDLFSANCLISHQVIISIFTILFFKTPDETTMSPVSEKEP